MSTRKTVWDSRLSFMLLSLVECSVFIIWCQMHRYAILQPLIFFHCINALMCSLPKVDINDYDNDGHTVMCWACYNGHKDLLEYMLSDNCPMSMYLGGSGLIYNNYSYIR